MTLTTRSGSQRSIEALTRIAPEIDPASIEPGVSFRDQLDLDSMDFLNFVARAPRASGRRHSGSRLSRASTRSTMRSHTWPLGSRQQQPTESRRLLSEIDDQTGTAGNHSLNSATFEC